MNINPNYERLPDERSQMLIARHENGCAVNMYPDEQYALLREVQELRRVVDEGKLADDLNWWKQEAEDCKARLLELSKENEDLRRKSNVKLEDAIARFCELNEGFPVERFKADYVIAWMLVNFPPALPAPRPELTVWYGSMPETNGKTNWTAILHRKGEGRCFDGFTIDRSEYPGRVRYAADRVRYLIGELAERPHILSYDADEHSGYVWPRTKESAAVETLESKGYTWNGGQFWKPPIGNAPAYIAGDKPKSDLLQRAEKLAEDAAALSQRVDSDACEWSYDDNDHKWDGKCGASWTFFEDGPTENRMTFCPGCGKPVSVVRAEGDE